MVEFKNKDDIKSFIKNELIKQNIKDKWHIKIVNSKKIYGSMSFSENQINISTYWYKFPLSKKDSKLLVDTVLHEIAHIKDFNNRGNITKSKYHDEEWKILCKEIGCLPVALQYNIPIFI